MIPIKGDKRDRLNKERLLIEKEKKDKEMKKLEN